MDEPTAYPLGLDGLLSSAPPMPAAHPFDPVVLKGKDDGLNRTGSRPIPSNLFRKAIPTTPKRELLYVEERLNRVFDHIETNLDSPLELEKLASLAAYSPFHFLRIFRSKFGETPYDFVRRRRVSIASGRLRLTDESIKDVAAATGFASGETLARAFRDAYGMSAGDWRRGGWRRWQAEAPAVVTSTPFTKFQPKVSVVRQPARLCIYRRLRGAYDLTAPRAWIHFVRWIQSLGLEPVSWIGMGLDDPLVTPAEHCRYDVCAVMPEGVTRESLESFRHGPAKISTKEGGEGLYALLPYEGTARGMAEAWRIFLEEWLPASGYTARPGFYGESFASPEHLPASSGEDHQVCQLMMPIRSNHGGHSR